MKSQKLFISWIALLAICVIVLFTPLGLDILRYFPSHGGFLGIPSFVIIDKANSDGKFYIKYDDYKVSIFFNPKESSRVIYLASKYYESAGSKMSIFETLDERGFIVEISQEKKMELGKYCVEIQTGQQCWSSDNKDALSLKKAGYEICIVDMEKWISDRGGLRNSALSDDEISRSYSRSKIVNFWLWWRLHGTEMASVERVKSLK